MTETIIIIICIVSVIIALITDLRTRIIPNSLVAICILSGLIINSYSYGWIGFKVSMIGFLASGTFFLLFFIFGEGIGAGDVKLVAGLGALLKWPTALFLIIMISLSGGIIALIYLIVKGKIIAFIKRKPEAKGIKLPYAPAIALGTLLSIFLGKYFAG